MSDELATKADLAHITHVKSELLERLEKLETTLLKEFHKWAQITETRIRVNETLAFGLNERMVSLESRVRDLEQKRN
jgi:flagellar biosynthesis/type III secretory pathway chaperone